MWSAAMGGWVSGWTGAQTNEGSWVWMARCFVSQLNHQTAVNLQLIKKEKVTPATALCYTRWADGQIREIDRKLKREKGE